MDLEEADLKIQFDMLTSDEAKATQLNGLITNGLQFGRQMMMSQMMVAWTWMTQWRMPLVGTWKDFQVCSLPR